MSHATWQEHEQARATAPSGPTDIDATLIALEAALDFCADQPLELDRMSLTRIWRDILAGTA